MVSNVLTHANAACNLPQETPISNAHGEYLIIHASTYMNQIAMSHRQNEGK
jgi:hypothetical protein